VAGKSCDELGNRVQEPSVRVFSQFQGVALVKPSGMRKGKAILKLASLKLELKAEAVKAFDESAEATSKR
jgi:hydroxymethylpyrimidine pyrophosphatase-like HAD family hydrolase